MAGAFMAGVLSRKPGFYTNSPTPTVFLLHTGKTNLGKTHFPLPRAKNRRRQVFSFFFTLIISATCTTVTDLTYASPSDENSLAAPTNVLPTTNTISNAGTNFTVTLPANSLSILRLPAGGINFTQPTNVPAALVHRYSFNDAPGSATAADSIGGAAWNGTLPNGGAFTNGQLSLAAAKKQFLQLPAGILSNYAAVTIEAWAAFPNQLPVNCFFYGFGNTNGASGVNYIFCAPRAGRIAITSGNYPGEQNAAGAGDFSFHTNYHITAVYKPPAGYLALYTNGVLAAINNPVTIQFSS